MLKIKDDVDLRELEKFGFESNKCNYIKQKADYDKEDKIFIEAFTSVIEISKKSREIQMFTENEDKQFKRLPYTLEFQLGDTLYDLIKADMVVKTDE